jgi:NAD(P)-dependent dehydrogenase (short-subunit alcohol dehydrogenase family)
VGAGPAGSAMKLQSCRAIITGCSRGLGAVIANSMWREGADLLLVARSEAGLREVRDRLGSAAGQHAHFFAADLLDPSAPAAIMAEARRLWPRVEILVNNAGIAGPIGMVADNDWREWRDALQVNLLAPAELCKLSIAWMRETGGGRIVNLSGGGATNPRPRFSAYGTAKCALVRFSETIAAEVAGLGIRVNCISPGMLNTDMLQDVLRAGPERLGAADYQQVQKAVAGGTADPKMAAELIVYLASEESAGINGKLISAVWDPWRGLHRHIDDLKDTDIYTLRRIVPEDRGKEWGSE